MATYNVSVLTIYDATTTAPGGFSGDPGGWNLLGHTVTLATNQMLRIEVEDADQWFDDDEAGQVLTKDVATPYGTAYAGSELQNEYAFTLQDAMGTQYTVLAVSIGLNWQPVGFAFLNDIPPDGVALSVVSVADVRSNVDLYTQLVPCLAEETRVLTAYGPRAVGTLRPGDLVMTEDGGPQPVRIVLRRTVDCRPAPDRLAPILFRTDSLGSGRPAADLVVSRQHRILMRMGAQDVLVPAAALTDMPGVRIMLGRERVSYVNLAFDRHEIIRAEGALVETFLPGPQAGLAVSGADLLRLTALYIAPPSPARPLVSPGEWRRSSQTKRAGPSARPLT